MKFTMPLLKKVYKVSKKHDAPRLWLQHIVCEAAGFTPGADLFVRIDEKEKMIIIQNQPYDDDGFDHEISVSSRINRTSGQPRPLVDTCGSRYATILNVQEKIEISVYRRGNISQVVVRPLRYRLFESDKVEPPSDERIRLLSICSGAGLGTAVFVESQYYTAVQEIEIDEDSAGVSKHNFPYSYLFNGDLRDCHTVAKADVAFVTLDCSEHSSLGDGGKDILTTLFLAPIKYYKLQNRVPFFLRMSRVSIAHQVILH
ncbi:hypothetical protein ACFQ88_22555 [Paenibacillus sp. NPDC056579]|uniref:hypothetical protein n=1 Tax=Paenibacillus sp. NPDC056579 TaxID=3345871 RepID=UPI00369971D7